MDAFMNRRPAIYVDSKECVCGRIEREEEKKMGKTDRMEMFQKDIRIMCIHVYV